MRFIPFALSFALLLLSSCTAQQIQSTLNTLMDTPLTAEEVGRGLKEALTKGSTRGANELSQDGGYFNDAAYRILLPQEARKVTDRLRVIPGFSNLEDEIIRKINQGAEDAAKQAAPIFLDAIKRMTIQDAFNILRGENDAATDYLVANTRNQLYGKFSPVINRSLDKFDARKIWSDATNKYNSIPLVQDVNTDLGAYVTNQALDGLFKKVALEELNIRQNINARTSDLLRKVFAAQDPEQ